MSDRIDNHTIRDVRNQGTKIIPPYGVMVATGAADGFFDVDQKQSTIPPLAVFLNGPLRIKPKAGQGISVAYPLPARVMPVSQSETLDPGDMVGAVNDSFDLEPSGVGFVLIGKTDIETDAGAAEIWWVDKVAGSGPLFRATEAADDTETGKIKGGWVDGAGVPSTKQALYKVMTTDPAP